MATDKSAHFPESADVVVVGFGAAGACAAIAAREHGADVVAMDRANGGGSTAVSGGIIYAGGGTKTQQQAGVSDSFEQMLTYLRLEVGDAVSQPTLESFVAGSPEMIRWLGDYGVPFDSTLCPYKTSYPNNHYYLYHSGSENAGAFRSHTPPVQRGHRVKGKGTSGKKLYEPLAKSALALGVQFHPLTTAMKLVQDSAGRVTGVEALTMHYAPSRIRRLYSTLSGLSTKPGIYYPPLRRQVERRLRQLQRRYAQPVRITARRGVIVCAGGFIANTQWVQRFAPQYLGGLHLGTSGDDGNLDAACGHVRHGPRHAYALIFASFCAINRFKVKKRPPHPPPLRHGAIFLWPTMRKTSSAGVFCAHGASARHFDPFPVRHRHSTPQGVPCVFVE